MCTPTLPLARCAPTLVLRQGLTGRNERSAEERALLEAASSGSRTSLSDLIRRKALEAAEMEVLERNIVTIQAKDWEAFESWVRRPPKVVPARRKLARRIPTWQA